MTHRAALVGIVVEDTASISRMNEILSDYSAYIVGRMGLPYRERGVSIISVVLDAPDNVISLSVRQDRHAARHFFKDSLFQTFDDEEEK